MARPTGNKKEFNPTVTAFWENEKFGEGAMLSAELDAKAYDVLQNLQIGQKLLIKPYSKGGKTTYFMEALPKFVKTKERPSQSPQSDDI